MENRNYIPEQMKSELEEYIETNILKARRLLMDLSVIPAPSGKEGRRASFIRRWLEEQGAAGVYLDAAGNVIYPYEAECRDDLIVFMAHMDIVFPDEAQLVIRQKGNLLCGPGVGDDTANLVNLLMAAAYVAEKKPSFGCGILFVADTGEEGLGNLRGCRQLMTDFKDRISQVISFDLYLGQCFDNCVGSVRYRIRVTTEGGHSFHDFGRPNAICELSRVITALYSQPLPDCEPGCVTFNVGTINGGTSVNTIAQEAECLYEIRALKAEDMKVMTESFDRIIGTMKREGMQLEVIPVGERPCAVLGEEAKERQKALTSRICRLIGLAFSGQVGCENASTDANIPLSMGIPAVTLGTISGGGAHTREEWIDLDSLKAGFLTALLLVNDLPFFGVGSL